jgi:hypothetical protein
MVVGKFVGAILSTRTWDSGATIKLEKDCLTKACYRS